MKHVPWRFLTLLGDPLARGAWVTLTVELLLIRGYRRMAVVPIATVGGTGLMNSLVKRLVARRRPQKFLGMAQKSSHSFPSGHASGSVALAGTISYLVWRLTGGRLHTFASVMVGGALAGLIGQSRIVIGRHHPSDAAGGYVLGLISAGLVLWTLERVGWLRDDRPDDSHRSSP